MLAPLEERAGGVDEQAGFAFGDGDRAQVDAAGHVDGGSGVPERHGDVDAVHLGVGGAEGGPAQVAVYPEPSCGVVGFGEQFVGGAAVVVLGGGDCAAQQQRPVDRQRFGSVGGDIPVQPRGLAAGGVDRRGEMAAVHQGVGDDAGAGPGRDRIFAGLGGAHAAVGGQVGKALVIELEQEPGGDVVRVGGQRISL